MNKSKIAVYLYWKINSIVKSNARIRSFIYSFLFPVGKDTYIHKNFIAHNFIGLKIGNNCFINNNCFIQASGGVTIGDNVMIGPNVTILSENHKFNNKTTNIINQGVEKKEVIIKNNVWIGVNAVILPGVILKEGTVVGAGAVVTKSFDANSVIGGVPAKLINKI